MAKIKKSPLIPVHLNKQEVKLLDLLQGGPAFDKETGMRDYSRCGKVINNPIVQELFIKSAQDWQDGKLEDPFLRQAYAIGGSVFKNTKYAKAPSDFIPAIEKVQKLGIDGDTELVWMPETVSNFLNMLMGDHGVNPYTGFPQHGNFFEDIFGSVGKSFKSAAKIVLPVAGAIVGGMLGGPGGAMAGASLGGFGGGLANGDSLGRALGRGATAGALTYGGQSLASAFPGAAGSMGETIKGIPGIGEVLHKAGSAALGQGTPSIMSGLAGAAGSQSGMSGLLGNLSMPLSLAGLGMTAYGKHQEQKMSERHYRDQRADYERERQAYEAERTPAPRPSYVSPDLEEWMRNRPSRFTERKSGGLIGRGDGQSDLIYKRVPEGTYIVDADATSAAGNGSTQAGFKRWDDFSREILRKAPRAIKQMGNRGLPMVDTALSNGEYEISPAVVTALGNGSNALGSKELKAMIERLRASKQHSTRTIPPKARPLTSYLGR